LKLILNGKTYVSKNGLLDLLQRKTNADELRYPIIHLKGDDIEVAITHENQYGEEYYSFVNGQFTTQGGTHLAAFREAFVKTIREFYKKDYEPSDIRGSICAAISVRVQEPVFESQTKTKLGSQYVSEGGLSMKNFIAEFLMKELDLYLHRNVTVAEALKKTVATIITTKPPAKSAMPFWKNKKKAHSSLPRAIAPAALSLKRGMWKHRPYSACGVSRSTVLALPKKWCTKMKNSTCCNMH
jgi:DNA gyrase/topoisomerase IV subunit B